MSGRHRLLTTHGMARQAACHFPKLLLAVAIAACIAAMMRYHHAAITPSADKAAAAAGFVLIALYLAWLLWEAPVTLRAVPGQPAEQRTLVVYATARVAVCAAAVGGAPSSRLSWWMVTAGAVFCTGIVLRLVAIRHLGRFYSHHVVRPDAQGIVTSGPYRIVRHPAYAGMVLAHLGFVTFFPRPSSIALLVVLLVVILWRIRVEERVLRTVSTYIDYARRTPRLVPGLW